MLIDNKFTLPIEIPFFYNTQLFLTILRSINLIKTDEKTRNDFLYSIHLTRKEKKKLDRKIMSHRNYGIPGYITRS